MAVAFHVRDHNPFDPEAIARRACDYWSKDAAGNYVYTPGYDLPPGSHCPVCVERRGPDFKGPRQGAKAWSPEAEKQT